MKKIMWISLLLFLLAPSVCLASGDQWADVVRIVHAPVKIITNGQMGNEVRIVDLRARRKDSGVWSIYWDVVLVTEKVYNERPFTFLEPFFYSTEAGTISDISFRDGVLRFSLVRADGQRNAHITCQKDRAGIYMINGTSSYFSLLLQEKLEEQWITVEKVSLPSQELFTPEAAAGK
jgi:hypothetical protein